MFQSMAKVVAATTLFAMMHSALASRPAKQGAARVMGERNRNGLYRVFYITQSLVTFGLLADYIRRQPSRELYRVEGPPAWLLRALQAGALVYATAAASQVGLDRITGLRSFAAWVGNGPVPPEPEAQGPALDDEACGRPLGPFAWSRHPLNFAPVLICWLNPRMTNNLLAFSVAATTYLVVASLHEEARLHEAFGEAYEDYQRSVPFYVPDPTGVCVFPANCELALNPEFGSIAASRCWNPLHNTSPTNIHSATD